MIPTYRPSEHHLRAAIDSVLAQDPGADEMQIEVVDDCSPGVDVAALVRRLGRGRVAFSQNPHNLGLAGGWNSCVAKARGHWVHLLHQDDLVYAGFYAELKNLAAVAPTAGAVFTRHAFADATGHWQLLSPLEQGDAGVLENWAARLAAWQQIQCVAIAVRRECYEELGGFHAELAYVLDWEMWSRIAHRHTFAFSPRILAAYRMHAGSETSRLQHRLQTLPDILLGHELILSRFDPSRRAAIHAEFTDRFTDLVWEHSREMLRQRRAAEARTLIAAYWSRLSAGRRTDFRILRFRCLVQQIKGSLS